jgi:hypothetical protein
MWKKQSTKRGARLVLDEFESIEYPVGTGGYTIHGATSPHCDLTGLVYADSREKSIVGDVKLAQIFRGYEKHKRTEDEGRKTDVFVVRRPSFVGFMA